MQDCKVHKLKKAFKLIFVVPILLSLSLLSADPIRIMPLGDSITKGYIVDDPSNEWGYRGPLWTKLIADGYSFDFVGSRSSGENYDLSFDSDHQGTNGYTTADIDDRVDNYLDTEDPQIVLLHIGTNDLSTSGYDVTTSTNNVKNILDKIYAHNTNIKILLARIINRKTYDANTTTFNDTIVTMANGHIADIDIIDMENGADINYTADMYDQLHPENTGYVKMADLWYSALKTVIPTHLWKLEETTGSTTYLDSFREANGTCIGNGCPIAAIGKTGNAQEFDGIEDKININNTSTFDWPVDANFTIEFWMKANSSSGNAYEVMVGRKGPGIDSLNDRWYIGIERSSGRITYGLGNSLGQEEHRTGQTVVDGSNGIDWNHIAFVVTSDRIILYVNGVIDTNRTRAFPGTDHIQGTPVNIGYLNQSTGFEYTGLLDEITIFSGALSEDQIKQRYGALEIITKPVTLAELNMPYMYDVNSNKDPIDAFTLNSPTPNWLTINDPASGVITGTPNELGNFDVEVEAMTSTETALQNYILKVRNTTIYPNGMIHYWKLDELSGPIYIDAYSAADGTCTDPGCPVATTEGKVDGAQEFDGTDDRIDVTDSSTFDWAIDDNITIEFWMKSNQVPTGSNDVMIGRKGLGEAAATDIWFVGRANGTGKLTYGLANRDGDLAYNILDVNITNNMWNHIAYVVTQDKIMLYVNAEIKLDRTRGISTGEHIQGTPLNIGYLNWSSRFDYTGLLDEITVFKRALSLPEIQEHVTNGLNGIGFGADATIPVITLLGSTPIDVARGSTYTDAGATASDDVDGNITANIITVNPVDTNTLGQYIVTYDVNDSAGNAALQVTRTVNVIDATIPVITLLGSTPIDVARGSTYTDAGATASDDVDGNITANIITVNPVDTNTLGQYIVTYDVNDSAGNAALQVTRTVNVIDATIPVITLLGSTPIDVARGSTYTDAGATASDDVDGNITANIITVNPVDTNTLGQYIVTYDVNDSAGNAALQVTRTVNVIDATIPVITLLGSTPIDVARGSTYTDAGATASDDVDGNITANIITVNPVDTNTLGQYIVTYDVNDSAGNAALQVTRTVNVIDATIPIITLIGANPQGIVVGAPYTELNATAQDDVDGNISANIAIDASAVDTNEVGSYTVTYNVSDTEGNAATEVTRTVNVVDATVSNSSGGGCSYNPNSKNFDMTFLLMMALGLYYPFRRRSLK